MDTRHGTLYVDHSRHVLSGTLLNRLVSGKKAVLTSRQKRISISTSVGSACPLGSVVNRIFQTSEVVHTLGESRTKRKGKQKETVLSSKNRPKNIIYQGEVLVLRPNTGFVLV